MKRFALVGLVPLLMLSSCFNNVGDEDAFIPYVGTVLSDTSSVGYHVLRAQDEKDKYRSISIAGDPVEVLPIINEMLSADHFNNIDGRQKPDGLPDFSGEMIEFLLDVTNSSYEGYLKNGNENFLREIQVKNFISALDTNYLYSPYDRNQLEERSGAKMVIFGSASSYVYGMHDVDTLCSLADVEIPLFSSVECLFDEALSKEKGNHLCIWTTADKVENKIYPLSYEKYNRKHGIVCGKDLLVYQPDIYVPVERRFTDILDMYLLSQSEGKISVMMVDDPEVDMEALDEFVKDLKASTDEAQLAYRNLLADDFELVYPAKAVAEAAYRHLRRVNGFTHKISYPLYKGYITLPVNDLPVTCYRNDGSYTDDFKYLRPDGTSDETWYVIAMRDRYVSEELRGLIGRLAPKIKI